MPSVIIKKQAAKALTKLPPRLAKRVRESIERIANGDIARLDIKPLAGARELYRLRIGGHRLVYTWADNRMTLLILKLKPRGDVYK